MRFQFIDKGFGGRTDLLDLIFGRRACVDQQGDRERLFGSAEIGDLLFFAVLEKFTLG